MPFRKVYVNVNTECNYNCLNCILHSEQRDKRNNPSLSLANLKAAEQQLIPLISDGVDNIWEISGGEPTIHSEFNKIIGHVYGLKEKGLMYKQVLLSNCHILSDRKRAEQISCAVSDVVTTIYTDNAKEHDSITGLNNSLSKKIRAAENLISHGVSVHIKTLVMKPSFKSLPAIAKLVGKEFGRNIHFTANTTHFIGDADANQIELAVRLTEAAPFVEEAIDVAMSYGSSIGIFFPLCFIDPIFWEHASIDYAAQVRRTYAITPSSKQFLKAKDLEREFVDRHEACSSCPLQIRCSWPWQSYTKIWGDSEILEGRKKIFQNKGGE